MSMKYSPPIVNMGASPLLLGRMRYAGVVWEYLLAGRVIPMRRLTAWPRLPDKSLLSPIMSYRSFSAKVSRSRAGQSPRVRQRTPRRV